MDILKEKDFRVVLTASLPDTIRVEIYQTIQGVEHRAYYTPVTRASWKDDEDDVDFATRAKQHALDWIKRFRGLHAAVEKVCAE